MTRLRSRGVWLLLLLPLVIVLAGCGSVVPTSSWPGLLVTGNTVYVTTPQGKLYAVAADSGTQQWEFPPKVEEKAPKPFTALAADEGLIFVGSFDNQLRAFDPTLPDKKRWEFSAQDAIVGAPAVVGNRLYVGSSDRHVYALDATNGSKLWSFSTGNWVWATPTVAGDRLYVGSMDHNLYSLDAASGQQHWKVAVDGGIAAQAALKDGVLYFGSLDGKLYAVDAARGEIIWKFQTGNWVWSEPVIADNTLFVASLDHKVYALEARTGAKIWEFDTGHPVRAGIVLGDKSLYVVTDGGTIGQVFALEAATGKQQWTKTLPKGSLTTPAVAGDVLYVVDLNGRVAALKRTDGTELWAFVPPK